MGNKITCGFCPTYNDMSLDKRESILIEDNPNNFVVSSRSHVARRSLDEKANLIQINFRD